MNNVLSWKYAIKPEQPKKIAVAMATHEMVPASFMYDLASLTMHSVANLGEGQEYGVEMVQGTYVHSARQQLLERMIQREVTHMLWLDTDMRFPRNALMRLLAHNLPVVGINYCQRGMPYEFVAIKCVGWGDVGVSEKLVTGQHSTGLEEVEAIGFGMVLIQTSILSCLPSLDDKPWFGFEWIGGRKQIGEDVRFCKFLTDAGHKIYVDHDLSKQCSHSGMYDYECYDAEAVLKDSQREVKAAAH